MTNPRYTQYGQYGASEHGRQHNEDQPFLQGQHDQVRRQWDEQSGPGRGGHDHQGGQRGYGGGQYGGQGGQSGMGFGGQSGFGQGGQTGGQTGGQSGYGQYGTGGRQGWEPMNWSAGWDEDRGGQSGGSGSEAGMGRASQGSDAYSGSRGMTDYGSDKGRSGGAYRSAQTRGNWGDDYGRGYGSGSGSGYGSGGYYGGMGTGGTGYAGPGGYAGYGGGQQTEHGRQGRQEERGFFERAGNEIASWFEGDDQRRQSHRGKGPQGYTRSDQRLEEDVNDRLCDDPRVDASNVRVKVQDGEVTLEGEIESKMAKRAAEDCVDSVSGVKHVQNNLRVRHHAGQSGSQIGSQSASQSGQYASQGALTSGSSVSGSSTGGTSSSGEGASSGRSGTSGSIPPAKKEL
jgi:osmotically-inducible protein OsmY